MKRLLCVWLPNWPIQRVQIEKRVGGELDPQAAPILLWHEDPRRGRLVTACCPRAQQAGVRVLMPIAQAGEMVRSSHKLPWVEPHDRLGDRVFLQQIANRLAQHITPLVAIETLDDKPWADHPRHQSESLLCDITGAAHLFQGEAGLLAAADELLSATGLHPRLAIADSAGAAWAIAHYARCHQHYARCHPPCTHDHDRGSDPGHDRGSDPGHAKHPVLAPTGESHRFLESLPVESLRLLPDTVATLKRLGVTHVNQLLRLPRSGLAPRLGNHLVGRIEQALGEVDEPLSFHHPEAEDSASLELEYPTSEQAILADRLRRLTQKITAGLTTRQRGALRVSCRLDLSAHPCVDFEIGLFAPTVDADHLSGLMIHRLETKSLPSCVQRLSVSVTHSRPLRSSQASLFGNDFCEVDFSPSGSNLSRFVDSLSGRLGRDAVVRVKLEDSPLPEEAFSVTPLAGNQARTAASSRRHQADGQTSGDRTSLLPSPEDAMRRPLSLLAQPIPLAVAFGDGFFFREVGSPRLPNRLRWQGRIHAVTRHWGPERIETGWWKGPSIGRDYYRIEIDCGQWWWIFRNLSPQTKAAQTKAAQTKAAQTKAAQTKAGQTKARYRWMLHGRFA